MNENSDTQAPKSRNYRTGYDQATSNPLTATLDYPHPANDLQRGWNDGRAELKLRIWETSPDLNGSVESESGH